MVSGTIIMLCNTMKTNESITPGDPLLIIIFHLSQSSQMISYIPPFKNYKMVLLTVVSYRKPTFGSHNRLLVLLCAVMSGYYLVTSVK